MTEQAAVVTPVWVLDAMCLIHFGRADRLDVLRGLLVDKECWTTRVVLEELSQGAVNRPALMEVAISDWLKIARLDTLDLAQERSSRPTHASMGSCEMSSRDTTPVRLGFASAQGRSGCPRPEVIAEVLVATHDGAEVARRFGPQPCWIDELVAAVTRPQGVHLVDITVDENRGPIVVGNCGAVILGHGWRVAPRQGRAISRYRPSRAGRRPGA